MVKAEVMTTLAKLQTGNRKLLALWKKTRAWSLREFSAVHKELDATFDTFYAESQFVDTRMKIVEQLKKKGIAVVSDGATIVHLEDVDLGVQVILRSDGTALYATTDLALWLQKPKDAKIDASYVITDARQKHHFAQLFETLRRFGSTHEMKHLPYEFVTLPGGAMSSRKGTIVLYEDFRDELVAAAAAETRKRHADWNDAKVHSAARAVAFAAMKYDMLRQDAEKPITFDIKSALSFDGVSGPYIQYTGARIASMLRKAPRLPRTPREPDSSLITAAERALTIALARYPEVVRLAATDVRPSLLAEYLFHLSKRFAEFYEVVPVLKAAPELRAFRIRLIQAVHTVLQNGVQILGFELPKEM